MVVDRKNYEIPFMYYPKTLGVFKLELQFIILNSISSPIFRVTIQGECV